MKRVAAVLLGSVMALGVVACENARTSADAPSSLTGSVNNPAQVEKTREDASSEIRQSQLSSDIRAREQRNDITGKQTVRSDSDLESEVRAKLEANIPRGKLTIAAKNGAVTVVGSVPNEKEYQTIKPLAKEILGVDSVAINVKVVPPVK